MMNDTTATAKQAIELLNTISAELDAAQRRCTQRRMTVNDVFAALKTAARDGEYTTRRQYVASSYGYPYTWTSCGADRTDDASQVHWAVGRVGAKYATPRSGHTVSCALLDAISRNPCLPGDQIAVRGRECWYRYDSNARCTGVAMRLPDDLRTRERKWEHGATIVECLREISHKRATAAAEREAHIRTQRVARRARLLARLSHRIPVSLSDARDLGYCWAGIRAWAASQAITLPAGPEIEQDQIRVPVSILAHSSDPQARRLAVTVASRYIRSAA